MRKLLLFASVLVALTSCARHTNPMSQQYHYHDDGQAKPQVAIVPVYDRSRANMPWDLSIELSEAFNIKVSESNRFYLTKEFDMLNLKHLRTSEVNPFLDDIDWIGEAETGTEFVVFIELVDHRLTPNGNGKGFISSKIFQSHNLEMSMRVKVIDVRQKKPRVILQELIEETYYIPWRISSIKYQKGGWSKTTFSLSPIGLAHGKMVKRVSSQLEEYILLAKLH